MSGDEKALGGAAAALELAGEVVARARGASAGASAALFAEVAAAMSPGPIGVNEAVDIIIDSADRIAIGEWAKGGQRAAFIAIAATAMARVVTLDAEARR